MAVPARCIAMVTLILGRLLLSRLVASDHAPLNIIGRFDLHNKRARHIILYIRAVI